MGPKKVLTLTLLENGLDFIREGVEALYTEDGASPPRAHKYAVLNVFSGTLLVLKERLRREHESLIFKDVSRSGVADAHTVDFDEVIRRLEGAAKVTLNADDRKLLRNVQQRRNALEHYEVNLELEEVNGLVGELVDFLERFLHEQLGDSLFRHVSGIAGRQIGELAKVAERLRTRRHAEWSARAAKYQQLSDTELEKLAEQGDYHPKHNPDATLLVCLECGEESVAVAPDDASVGICTNRECKAVHMLNTCARCGAAAILDDPDDFCADCLGYIEDQYDRD